MTSSTRPEINSASHGRQRRIKPLVTRTENLVKLDVWALDTRVDRQTNRQTDRHADQNTAHTYRGWSNDAKYNEQSKNFDKRPHRHLVTSHGGEWIRPSNTWFFGPHKSDPQTASWSVQQLCVHCSRLTMLSVERTTPKIAPCRWVTGTPWFFGPTRLSPQTASRLVQPFLQASWTRPNDRPRYSVCSNRLLSLTIAAMVPINGKSNGRLGRSFVYCWQHWAQTPDCWNGDKHKHHTIRRTAT